jgi:MFS transporter, DHA2 family, multidrug resistance protein
VGVKRLLAFGYFVFALAMWYYASFTLATDYRHEALARIMQGPGIATLFVPVSQLAYSNLPKNKNNKASSLTNLFRNQGGSFGIAFVTTLLARRSQYHQSVLVAHAVPSDQHYRQLLANLTDYFSAHGFSHADAVTSRPGAGVRFPGTPGFIPCVSGLLHRARLVRADGRPLGAAH